MSLLAAVLLAALTGCDTADGGADNGNPDPTAPTTTRSAAVLASDAVVAAYDQFWHRLRYLEDKPESKWTAEMSAVAVDPQLKLSLQAARFQKMNGIGLYGEVRSRIADVEIDGASATVVDCQDASKSGQIDVKSGENKTVGVGRNPIEARLELDDGQWKVAEITYPGGDC